jgi:hypothetical protein
MPRRDPDAGRERVVPVGHGVPRRHGRAEPRAGQLRLGGAGVREERHELVAAHARHRVGRPAGLREHHRHLDECLVARVVAEGVVDRLEPVEVHRDHEERGVRALRQREVLARLLAEAAAVEEAGQLVAHRLLAEPLVRGEEPILGGDERVRRRAQLDLRHRGGREILQDATCSGTPPARRRVDGAERAERLPLRGAQRDAGVRHDAELREREVLADERVRARVPHEQRRVGRRRRAGRTSARAGCPAPRPPSRRAPRARRSAAAGRPRATRARPAPRAAW